MENLVAVCDKQAEYAHRLMEYMNRKNSFSLKAAAFSNEDSILEYARKNRVDLLLISENMLNDKTCFLKADKKLVLRETVGFEEYPDLRKIDKFQSAEKIVKEVMSMYEAEMSVARTARALRKNKKIIGVYAPQGSVRKNSFAFAIGQILSRTSSTLYINLESFAGLSEILGYSCKSDIGELLYYANQPGCDYVSKLPLVSVTIQNLDIIPSARSPEDITGVESSKWVEILSNIMARSSYESLVIDFGNEVGCVSDILEICTSVYVPISDEPLDCARLNDFERYMSARGVDTSKIQRVHLPYNKVKALGKEYYENLIWSELGDYVRGLIA